MKLSCGKKHESFCIAHTRKPISSTKVPFLEFEAQGILLG
jgi:hypothetical protein